MPRPACASTHRHTYSTAQHSTPCIPSPTPTHAVARPPGCNSCSSPAPHRCHDGDNRLDDNNPIGIHGILAGRDTHRLSSIPRSLARLCACCPLS